MGHEPEKLDQMAVEKIESKDIGSRFRSISDIFFPTISVLKITASFCC